MYLTRVVTLSLAASAFTLLFGKGDGKPQLVRINRIEFRFYAQYVEFASGFVIPRAVYRYLNTFLRRYRLGQNCSFLSLCP